MKKKLIGMLVCVLLLGGLVGTYYGLNYRNTLKEAEAEPVEETPDKTTKLIDKTDKELKSAVFTTAESELTILQVVEKAEEEDKEDKISWTVEGCGDIPMDSTKLGDMARSMYQISSVETVLDKVDDMSEYGLEPPLAKATGEYTDGTTVTLRVGKKTPAKDYYYAMVDGDPALYMIYNSVGDRVNYTLNDLADKTVPTINGDTLTYIYFSEKDGQEVEFDYNGTEEEKNNDLEQFGGITLTMMKPYAGREMYSTNFTSNVMEKMGTIALKDLVDADDDDLSKYGLDDPELELWLKDTENELHMLVGDTVDDEYVYVKFYDRPQVFTANKEPFEAFRNVNVFKFIDRFVALLFINTCERIEVITKDVTYDIVTNHDILPPENDEEEGEEIMRPTVNGIEVQEKAFKTYYQALIGLSYDAEIPIYEPEGEPEVTVTYYFNNGSDPMVCKYYSYDENNNFYVVKKDDWDVQFVVNKQSMDMMFTTMDQLLAGELDR